MNEMNSSDRRSPSTLPRERRVTHTVCDLIARRFGISGLDVHPDSRFVEDLGIDPLDVSDLILALEEAFEIDISIAEALQVMTLKDAVKCVLSK